MTVAACLENIAVLAEKNGDPAAVKKAIQQTRAELAVAADAQSKELDAELTVWNDKISVILQETVGRKGLAKHARFWADKLRSTRVE